jgi:methionine-rich copper-binding protein CopC
MARSLVLFSLVLAFLLYTGITPSIGADAILISSTPAANGTIEGPDLSIKLRFNVKIQARGSKLAVVSAVGQETKVPIIAPLSDTGGPLAVAGRITGLQPGAYRLRWHVLGIDRQVSQGEIPFTVK